MRHYTSRSPKAVISAEAFRGETGVTQTGEAIKSQAEGGQSGARGSGLQDQLISRLERGTARENPQTALRSREFSAEMEVRGHGLDFYSSFPFFLSFFLIRDAFGLMAKGGGITLITRLGGVQGPFTCCYDF